MTRAVFAGKLQIGGGSPVSVQSMTNTDTADVQATVAQIHRMEEAGCQLARVSVNTEAAAKAVKDIRAAISIPLCVDIHFDYRLAIASVGADKIRINPSNIGGRAAVREVVEYCKANGLPIRIGGNLGSIRERGEIRPADALFQCVEQEVELLEREGFCDIVISAKASSVPVVVEVNRRLSKTFDYPLHVGLTEAGTFENSLLASSAAIGALLLDGVGDTVRYSMSDDPVKEVYAARKLLNVLELRHDMPIVVSCPTCARTNIDVVSLAARVEERSKTLKRPLKIAVMGCVVNGIGESADADVGIAGGKTQSAIFAHGKKLCTIANENAESELFRLIEKLDDEE